MAVIKSRITTANAALTQYLNALDAGAGNGTAKIYSGAVPADAETTPSGTLLAELTLSKPCGVVSGKKLTFSAITQDAAANADGVAGCVVLADSDGNAVVVGDVTVTGGTGLLRLNTTTIAAGGPVLINSFELTLP